MRQAEKEKIFSPEFRSYSTRARKFRKKFQKNLKNLFLALFLAKLGLDRPRKSEKIFIPEFRSYSIRERKFRKKQRQNSKNEKTSFWHYFQPIRMRQAEKWRKKIQSQIQLILDPGQKILKKIAKKLKNLFPALSLAKTGMRQTEKQGKKILVPNSVHTQLGKEKYEKNSKKVQKIKKPLSGIFISQNGMIQAEK